MIRGEGIVTMLFASLQAVARCFLERAGEGRRGQAGLTVNQSRSELHFIPRAMGDRCVEDLDDGVFGACSQMKHFRVFADEK
jgi:hypothetical protein